MNRHKVDRNQSKFDDREYQRYLEEQLDWITVEHDDLRKDLNEQLCTPKYHPSMSVIDQWEEEMIESIRRMAVFARRTLIYALDQNAYQVKMNMDKITPILRDSRAGIRPFTERDLKEWISLLRQWRKVPSLPIHIEKRNSIKELTLDLRNQSIDSFDDRHMKSYGLISILHSSSSKSIHQEQLSTLPQAATITPGGVMIIRE